MASILSGNDLTLGDKHAFTYTLYGTNDSVDIDSLDIGFVRCVVNSSSSPTGETTFAGIFTLDCATKTQFLIPAKQYNVYMRYYGGSSWSSWRQLLI